MDLRFLFILFSGEVLFLAHKLFLVGWLFFGYFGGIISEILVFAGLRVLEVVIVPLQTQNR